MATSREPHSIDLPRLDQGTEIHISGPDSWLKLSSLAEQFSASDWIFRGQGTDLPLCPKVGRSDVRKGNDGAGLGYSLAAEMRMFDRFRREARPHLNFQPSGQIEWLAIAQHFGLPTRLLDWSESFFVALYFAVMHGAARKSPTVYAFNFKNISEIEDSLNPFELKEIKIVRPPHVAARIPAQQGLFTIHNEPNSAFDSEAIIRIRICKHMALRIKKILSTAGINQGTLFPDLDNLSTAIHWREKWPEIHKLF